MELSTLNIFVKVVQTGSFTRAADQLHSQKAHVSRVISQLEQQLGVRLLERSTRSLSLTEVGREFFERAVGILEAVEDTERMVQRALGEPRGVLRLSSTVEFGMMVVSEWMNGYLEKYPDVTIDADFSARKVDLIHEGFDLAIRVGPLADSRLIARKLGELHYGLYASPDYLAEHGTPQHPEQLAHHSLIAFGAGSLNQSWELKHQEQTLKFDFNARLRVNNGFAVRNAIAQGLGIAKLPHIIVAPLLEQGALVPILEQWQFTRIPVHAVFVSNRYLSPKVRAFIDYALAKFT